MATDTCKSIIQYQNPSDDLVEPFHTERQNKALLMYDEGKTQFYPNEQPVSVPPNANGRLWEDHAAAQEFIDWVVERANIYNIEIDLDATYISDQPKEFWIDYSQQVDNKP